MKYYGLIGFRETVESSPGVYTPQVVDVDKHYAGDMLTYSSGWRNSQGVNDDRFINIQISILADPYAWQNFQFIKYAEYLGTKWEVTKVDVQYPRLVLTLGDVYHE